MTTPPAPKQAEAFTFGMEKVPEPSVESCIVALVTALQQSKGWMRGYADSIVRDAVDRVHLGASPLDVPHHPEPHTHTWTDMEKRCILAWGNALVAGQAAEKDAELERLRAALRTSRTHVQHNSLNAPKQWLRTQATFDLQEIDAAISARALAQQEAK